MSSILEENEKNHFIIRNETKSSFNNSSNNEENRNKESSLNDIKIIVKEEKKIKKNLFQKSIYDKNQKSNKRNSRARQGLKKGQWSIKEDELLEQWIKENGPRKWNQCGRFIQGRSGKQCREHWNNCLNPELIKGEWTSEEDFLIMYFYEECNGSWKKIIPLFNGRTENSIKNRFYSQLRKIATKDLSIEERKECAKIKLEQLKKFLNEAICDAKKELLSHMKMNEEELKEYVNKMKVKIQKKNLEENENSEVLSTNLGELENIKNNNALENNVNEINFLGKKRTESEELNNMLSSLENENENKNKNEQDYEQKLSNIINNDEESDSNMFTENFGLKTDFNNNFDNGNNNFNINENIYNNNDNNDKLQILNDFNCSNSLIDAFDYNKHQSENKEERFAFFSFDSIQNNLSDIPFKSQFIINSINDNNTIFNNNNIELLEE